MTVFEDGMAGLTVTMSTDSYTVSGDISGYRSISQLSDGDARVFVIRTATQFEVGLYTKSGGASPVLARTAIYMNHAGTQSAVNWSAGEKTIHSTVSANALMALNSADARTANILMRENVVLLDTDDDSGIYSDSDDVINFKINGTEIARFFNSSIPVFRLVWAESSANQGPIIQIARISTSPANNDFIGGVWFIGYNSVGAEEIYVQFDAFIQDKDDGSEDAGLRTYLYRNGSKVTGTQLQSNGFLIYPDIENSSCGLLVGKSAYNNEVGAYMRTDGVGSFIASGQTVLFVDRLVSDGTLVSFLKDSVSVGSISLASGTVTYNPFLGNHPSRIMDDRETYELRNPSPPIGTLVSTIDKTLDRLPHLPLVKITNKKQCKRVYGVFLGIDPESGDDLIAAVGAWKILVIGSVTAGDLLQSSEHVGIAERQLDDVRHSYTIAKVLISDNRMDVRLVSCAFV